jgi:HK97 family phage major capsid protein
MLGRPIIDTEKVPALGAEGDLGFYDFSYYLIGDRPGGTLESSPHQQFMNDVTVMKMTSRNDGRPWIQSAFQPLNGDTLSPFVVLGARAS